MNLAKKVNEENFKKEHKKKSDTSQNARREYLPKETKVKTTTFEQHDTNTTVDHKTGEIKNQSSNSTYIFPSEGEPNFIKLYVDSIITLKRLPKAHSKVVFEIIKRMTYANDDDGQVVSLTSYFKDDIAKACDIKVSSLNNIIYKLVDKEILMRLDRGVYQVNPYFFGKGDWKNIKKIRAKIAFSKNGIEFISEIEESN